MPHTHTHNAAEWLLYLNEERTREHKHDHQCAPRASGRQNFHKDGEKEAP